MRKKLASEEEKLTYRKLKNQIRRLTRQGKKILEKNIVKQIRSNPKSFWKYAQSKLKTRVGIPDLETKIGDSTSYTKNDQEKADLLQEYFSSVFTDEPLGDLPNFPKRIYSSELRNITVTNDIVKNKLLKLKTNKSPGPDKTHPRVPHEITPKITKPLTIIFNTSLRTMFLPSEWKKASASAIFKKGNKSLSKNYRPVSLTAILCQVLESIIRDSVIKHMRDNELFSDRQFGFIIGRSTVLQMLRVLDIWTEILDQGGSLDIIYCDFMKAFDKVPHRRLLLKKRKIWHYRKHPRLDQFFLTQKVTENTSKWLIFQTVTSHKWNSTRQCAGPTSLCNIYKWPPRCGRPRHIHISFRWWY